MGYFGIGPYDNDDGLDIKEVWEDYIPSGDSGWDGEKIFTFFKRVYYRGNLPAVSEGNSNEYIALAQKFEDHELELPNELNEKLALSLNLENKKERLSEWGDDKRKRENVIRRIAKKHNIELDNNAGIKEKSVHAKEIESLHTWFENIDKINSLLVNMSEKTIDWMESIKPDFIQMLEDYTWRFCDESDEDNAAELSNLRYLAVVWFVFFNLQYKPEEIRNILEKAKE